MAFNLSRKRLREMGVPEDMNADDVAAFFGLPDDDLMHQQKPPPHTAEVFHASPGPHGGRPGSSDEEALAGAITVLQRIADIAYRAEDEALALCSINNLARDTIDALASRKLS